MYAMNVHAMYAKNVHAMYVHVCVCQYVHIMYVLTHTYIQICAHKNILVALMDSLDLSPSHTGTRKVFLEPGVNTSTCTTVK